MTYQSRVGTFSLAVSGWGVGVYDFNNDGWKDVFVADGDVQDNTELYSSGHSKQRNLLLLNDGKGQVPITICGASGAPSWSGVCRFRSRWSCRCGGNAARGVACGAS